VGSTVSPELLEQFARMNHLQQEIDIAHDVMNSHIMLRRSLAMTINELSDMKVDITPLTDKLPDIEQFITGAAQTYLGTKIRNETAIQSLCSEMSKIETSGTESIIDFGLSKYVPLPLSAESLNMDSQYFSFDGDMQDDTISSIEKFIRAGTGHVPGSSDKTAKEVSTQIMNQVQNHSISGTLIIVAHCTHRNVGTFQPLVIDTEKAVNVWNSLYENNPISLPPESTATGGDGDKDSLSIITGATYGSSFVGMVHILREDSKKMGEFEKLKSDFEDKLRIGGWLANASGGFGVDEKAMADITGFLQNQSVSSHISIITVGAIPDFGSHELTASISKLASVDEASMRDILNAGKTEHSSTGAEAHATQQKNLVAGIMNVRAKLIMDKVQQIDANKNKTLDINSLMEAFTNYVMIVSGKGHEKHEGLITGAPINFHTKRVTKGDIVRLLTKKYQAEAEEKADAENTQKDNNTRKNHRHETT
jgi:hypothetical protein